MAAIMKILEVCSYLYPALSYGGPAKVVYDLSAELAKKHQVIIYTTDVWDQQRRIKNTEKLPAKRLLRIEYFKNVVNSWAYTARFFTGFGMIVHYGKKWQSYDVVHLHDVYIIPQLLIGYMALWHRKPLVISPHGVLDPVRSQRRSLVKAAVWLIAKPLLRRATVLIATSDKEATDLCTLGLKNSIVIENGIPQLTTKPSHRFSNLKTTKQTLLYVGKLHPQKGLLELVKAYATVADKYQLIIAGPDDGLLKELIAYKNTHHLADLQLVGYVTDTDKRALFALADLFVYPSHAEGFSISILEALQAGVPVLITKGCNFPRVAEYAAGTILPGRNLVKELTMFLKSYQPTSAQSKKQQQNARQLIADYYSIGIMAAQVEKLYEQCLYL